AAPSRHACASADVTRARERFPDLPASKGENPLKPRSSRLAAAQVETLSEELTGILEREGSLDPIEGFGPAISGKMTVLLQTGRSPYLEQLEAEIPPTLLQITGLPGVAPRTAALPWREAGSTTLRAPGAGCCRA